MSWGERESSASRLPRSVHRQRRSPMKIRYLASVAVVAAVSSTPVFAQTKTITIDGSSTVFPSLRPSRRSSRQGQGADPRDGRHLRHRRRLQEVLPRRNRHLQRLAPDPQGRDRCLQAGRHRILRAADRLRRADRCRQPQEHLPRHASRLPNSRRSGSPPPRAR